MAAPAGARGTRWRGFSLALTAVGIAVSMVLAYGSVREVDFARFRAALAHSDIALIGASVIMLAAGVAVRAARWRALFEPRSRPHFGPAFRALLVSYLFNNILPARAGEAVRIVV